MHCSPQNVHPPPHCKENPPPAPSFEKKPDMYAHVFTHIHTHAHPESILASHNRVPHMNDHQPAHWSKTMTAIYGVGVGGSEYNARPVNRISDILCVQAFASGIRLAYVLRIGGHSQDGRQAMPRICKLELPVHHLVKLKVPMWR